MIHKNHPFVVYTIKFSTIKKFVVLDLCVGTGIYYAAKLISSSVIFAMLAASLGAEGIKRLQKHLSKTFRYTSSF